MEKEAQAESMATVNIKPDYPPSEYSSEPPPAYVRPQSTAVQVAKIVAVTMVVMSVVLGGFILASAYVSANASCRQLEQELELLSEAADRFQQSQAPLQPEALVQDEPLATKRQADNDDSKKEIVNNNIDNTDDKDDDSSSSSSSSESDDEERTPIHFKLPLQLDFDDLAGALIEKNQKSRMNCVVEKKRAEEFVDHQPKTVRLPFGLNLTTDPRIERLSGERMAIFCESGNMQRTEPQQQQQDDDQQEDTIMIQPVVIPIPHTNFQTHMPQQMAPQPQQPQLPFPMHPQMRPVPQQAPQQFHRIFPVEGMRPPMPPPMAIQQQPQVPQQQSEETGFPPSQILQQIAQQIVAQKIMESQKAQDEQETSSQPDSNDNRMPIPEEILTQLNRLPNRDGISIVAVAEPDSDESAESQEQTLQVIQEPRRSAHAMNGKQTYGNGVFVTMGMQQEQQEQEPQAAASAERPHYVQPRSVRNTRSVDALLGTQKRVKRCSCDCAC